MRFYCTYIFFTNQEIFSCNFKPIIFTFDVNPSDLATIIKTMPLHPAVILKNQLFEH